MEGLLCRWASSLQEYSFIIIYHKGNANANTDSLSLSAATFCDMGIPPQVLKDAQQCDPVTNPLNDQLSRSHEKPTDAKWCKQHLHRYLQLYGSNYFL